MRGEGEQAMAAHRHMRAELLGVDAEGLSDIDRAAASRRTVSANHAVGAGAFHRQRLAGVSAAPASDLRP